MTYVPIDYVAALGALQTFPIFDIRSHAKTMLEIGGARAVLDLLRWIKRDAPWLLESALFKCREFLTQNSKVDLSSLLGRETECGSSPVVKFDDYKQAN
jgi:hypothetical protein